MKMLMRVSLGLAVLAGVAPLSVGFSEMVYDDGAVYTPAEVQPSKANFDSGRFGTDTVTTGGIQTGGTVTRGIQTGGDSVNVFMGDDGTYTASNSSGVDVTNTAAGKKAIYDAANSAGEGMAIDETQHGMALAGSNGGLKAGVVNKAEMSNDDKSKKICNMKQVEASQAGADDATLDAFTASKGAPLSQGACRKAIQEKLQACGSGKFEEAKALNEKLEAACNEQEMTGNEVDSPAPQANNLANVVQGAGDALQQQVQQAQGILRQMLGGNLTGAPLNAGSILGGMNIQGILGMVSQQMVSKLMEKLTGGGEGSGSGGDDGSNAGSSTDDDETLPTCDNVTATNNARKTQVVSDVTVTTVLIVDSCANGRTRTRSTITMEYPDGTSETKNAEAVK